MDPDGVVQPDSTVGDTADHGGPSCTIVGAAVVSAAMMWYAVSTRGVRIPAHVFSLSWDHEGSENSGCGGDTLHERRKFMFNSESDRQRFVDALPDIQGRLEGFLSDVKFHAMRGVKGSFQRINVEFTKETVDPKEPTSLTINIIFTVVWTHGTPKSKQMIKKADIPDACRMFFSELARHAGQTKLD